MSRVLLRIDASSRINESYSRSFADEVEKTLQKQTHFDQIVYRDLMWDLVLQPDEHYFSAMLRYQCKETSAGVSELALSEKLIGELEATNVLLISTPVHNYSVPVSLKIWIDYVVRIGRTFQVSPNGKIGLLNNRPVVIVSASGGFFTSGAKQPDFFKDYMNAILGTIGINNVHHIRLEGLAHGTDAVEHAYVMAQHSLQHIIENF